MSKTLRLILGDQLNQKHHWYKAKNDQVLYVMMEMRQETDYVSHHVQKVIAFFMAMRSFCKWLKDEGHEVIYLSLDNPENEQNLIKNLRKLIIENNVDLFEYQLPDEFRLDTQLKFFCQELTINSKFYDCEHFLTSRTFLAEFFKGKKNFLMESFYREMRKKFQILMAGDEPIAGKWNFDQENRNKLKDPSLLKPSKNYRKNVSEIRRLLEKEEVATIGKLMEDELTWPTTREESLDLLEYFCHQLLPKFGEFQDAMYTGDAFLFHSKLSFSLNTKMISPLEVVKKVENYWYENQESIRISQVEGLYDKL
jgi:deoxyribodipyrimidine photolyase-related protein